MPLADMKSCGKLCATGKDRVRWTPSLTKAFESAVQNTGGIDYTTPAMIKDEMRVFDLTVGQIKSHLQKVRRDRFQPGAASGRDAPARDSLLMSTSDISNKLQEEFRNLPFEC